MKRKFIALAIASCLVSTMSYSQIKKGSILLGGSVGFSSSKTTEVQPNSWVGETKKNSLFLSPSVGVAIQDNLVLGADLTFASIRGKYNSPALETNKSTGYGGGVFIRKYWQLANKFYVFGNGRVGYQFSKEATPSHVSSVKTEYKNQRAAASIAPGISFAVSRRVHLESTFINLLTVEYSKTREYNKASGVETKSSSDLYLTSSFEQNSAFTVGIRFLLSK